MEIIKAENIGVKFKLSRNRSASFRRRISETLSNEESQEKYFWALKDVSFSIDKGDILGVEEVMAQVRALYYALLAVFMHLTKEN